MFSVVSHIAVAAVVVLVLGALGVVALLAVAAVSRRAWPAHARQWRRPRRRRWRRRVPALVNHTQTPQSASANQLIVSGEAWWTRAAPAGADERAWRPHAEEIAEVGRVEWDPRTLRTFAGHPDVLAHLAFHRWRYRQGALTEFGNPPHSANESASDTLPEE